MKKTVLFLFVTASMALTSAPAFAQNYWVVSVNEAESLAKGMALCKSRAKHPDRCRFVKMLRSSDGRYKAVYVAH
ncbi:hypothetical protein [Cohaesibacter gelatinilyticus]|uniref:DUF4189 domain-containing protein n=1 Tax=Cohaesibacter gelatinilyticus TaxID=372072 RepID=A0A285PE37_9HYPH|nr:hypothetical protein [Cohaesibacter gelatinilyticus]SNZ19467.1 hypothetical protein SAMN06265368_2555 [Cohaesibacter gelatinilyticus]